MPLSSKGRSDQCNTASTTVFVFHVKSFPQLLSDLLLSTFTSEILLKVVWRYKFMLGLVNCKLSCTVFWLVISLGSPDVFSLDWWDSIMKHVQFRLDCQRSGCQVGRHFWYSVCKFSPCFQQVTAPFPPLPSTSQRFLWRLPTSPLLQRLNMKIGKENLPDCAIGDFTASYRYFQPILLFLAPPSIPFPEVPRKANSWTF